MNADIFLFPDEEEMIGNKGHIKKHRRNMCQFNIFMLCLILTVIVMAVSFLWLYYTCQNLQNELLELKSANPQLVGNK